MRRLTEVGITGAVRHALGASVGVTVGPAGRGVADACTGEVALRMTCGVTAGSVSDGKGLLNDPALEMTGVTVIVGVLRGPSSESAGDVLHAAMINNNPAHNETKWVWDQVLLTHARR
jgi:hypothetical protein